MGSTDIANKKFGTAVTLMRSRCFYWLQMRVANGFSSLDCKFRCESHVQRTSVSYSEQVLAILARYRSISCEGCQIDDSLHFIAEEAYLQEAYCRV